MLPCVGTMLFTSIYGIVDGLCVSNFVGKTAFAAVNLIMPVPMLVGSVGFMLGTGGSAIVGITLGEGDREKADRYFSLFVWTASWRARPRRCRLFCRPPGSGAAGCQRARCWTTPSGMAAS